MSDRFIHHSSSVHPFEPVRRYPYPEEIQREPPMSPRRKLAVWVAAFSLSWLVTITLCYGAYRLAAALL